MRVDTLVGGGAGEGRTAEDKLGRDLVATIFTTIAKTMMVDWS